MKKTLGFIIIYIGELKYYERLFSRIEDEFNIHLVFIRPDDERRKKVIAYAKENGYNFTIINYDLGGMSEKGINIPFLSHLVKYYKHPKIHTIFGPMHHGARYKLLSLQLFEKQEQLSLLDNIYHTV